MTTGLATGRRIRTVFMSLLWMILLSAGVWPVVAHTVHAQEATGKDVSSGVVLPSLKDVLAAGRDLWGEAAIAQPDGPSYEFFAGLLPPLRYVNTAFRHYPIVLSAPANPVKIRFVSNGSAVNAQASSPTWHEVGVPVYFTLGESDEPFGQQLTNLVGPQFLDGWLPVVALRYRFGQHLVEEEAFAAVSDLGRQCGMCLVRFRLVGGDPCTVRAKISTDRSLRFEDARLTFEDGSVVVWTSDGWKWQPDQKALACRLGPERPVYLALFTAPTTAAAIPGEALSTKTYEAEKQHCVDLWQELLGRGAKLTVPEERVDRAWRAILVALFMIAQGNQMNYSAQNAYATDYADESGVPVQALIMYGLAPMARPFVEDLLAFDRQPYLRFHNAAFKLQLLSRYFWLTGDADFVRQMRPLWQPELEGILKSREPSTGLLPKEAYCGDINTKVYNLSTNANCWRAIRDLAAVLEAIGEPDPRLADWARSYREAIIDAVNKSVDRSSDPPFIPIALFGAEKAYPVLTASMLGSYWVLMSNYVLRSGVFDQQPELARAVADYLQQRGGLCMGLLRFDQHSGLFANTQAVDDLYTLGYVLYQLRVDEVDRALVSFYGKLAQGLTRDTFVGAEGTGLVPLDEFGRPMYLPPNTASAAFFLWTLRYLLVQDWDENDDGRPETLRLLHATPRLWLRSGSTIELEGMPTAFGPVSLSVQSRLEQGEVIGWVDLPARKPEKVRLRLRLPTAWQIVAAVVEKSPAAVDQTGSFDLPQAAGRIHFVVKVKRVAD